MANPYVVINTALQDATLNDHEKILRGLLASADYTDHSLSIAILLRLVELLSTRLSYVETQLQGCADTLAHHKLDA
jgi:hypothetical protein